MPYIDDVFAELDANQFNPATDILEIIGNDQPGGGDAFSLEGGEGTLVYLIDWTKARSFIRSCLGFSYADRDSPYKLHRENPWIHPRFPWLTASTISFSSTAPVSNSVDGVPAGTPNTPAVFTDAPIQKTGLYRKCYATVRFKDVPWTFRPDTFVTTYADELDRNVWFEPRSTVEMLSAEGPLGQMKWAETGTGGPTIGNPIPAPFGTVVPKVNYTLNWMHVPESYLSTDNFAFRPTKILDLVGKVNSATFGTFAASTLLMLAPTFQRFRFPVSTFDGLYPFYGWNIKVPLVFFQPRPRGATSPSDDGYRLLPWAYNLSWYSAKRADSTTYLYQESDLLTMFKHISA